jgi:hypothetical protein
MENTALAIAVAAGLIGAACYVYAFLVRSSDFRPKHIIALACNVFALWQIAFGLKTSEPTNIVCGVVFIAIGTIALSAAAVDTRKRAT